MDLARQISLWITGGKPEPPGVEPEPEPEPEPTPAELLAAEYRRWQRGELSSDDRRGPLERATGL